MVITNSTSVKLESCITVLGYQRAQQVVFIGIDSRYWNAISDWQTSTVHSIEDIFSCLAICFYHDSKTVTVIRGNYLKQIQLTHDNFNKNRLTELLFTFPVRILLETLDISLAWHTCLSFRTQVHFRVFLSQFDKKPLFTASLQ